MGDYVIERAHCPSFHQDETGLAGLLDDATMVK